MDSTESRDRDQACNECRRRKARCDKQLPECGPCKKNRRHCLYERHSKTPLTRKYLTEVEEQLRRAQIQAARAEERARLAETRLLALQRQPPSTTREDDDEDDQPATIEENNINGDYTSDTIEPATDEHPIFFEGPPSGPADFSWDEQSPDGIPEAAGDTQTYTSQGDDERTVDGMASLTVDDTEAGYLGVASGAAMLRLLLPDAQHGRTTRLASKIPDMGTCASNQLLETPLWDTLDLGTVDFDAAINAYFALYHNSYPLVEEHTFRAQYAQVIPRPNGRSWHALAFMIAAVGHFTSATHPTDTDRRLFMAAQSNMSIDSLETGNITLVQTLTLMSNYLQKRNKPNSGYNYLGLALHMAMGLGLHKEFRGWDISPLNMEIRRRVWWCIFVFNVGAAITFGRPLAWPNKNVELSLPLNVPSRALTNLSRSIPKEADHATPYSSVIIQSRFHMLTNEIYTRVISMPYPPTAELIRLDDSLIGAWEASVPSWYRRDASVPRPFATGHAIMWWRKSNFKIIMYRPFVMRRVLQARSQESGLAAVPPAAQEAYNRCLFEAETSINDISHFWSTSPPTRLAAWYALYFLFQASLIPCVCLRNEPTSPMSASWRSQIRQTMQTMQLIAPVNPSAQECHDVLQRLCGPFLQPHAPEPNEQVGVTPGATATVLEFPTQESPQTQINNVYAMMWPNANPGDVDVLMQDGLWTGFFPDMEDTNQQQQQQQQQALDGPGDTDGQYPWG